jgi:hypothetical protein
VLDRLGDLEKRRSLMEVKYDRPPGLGMSLPGYGRGADDKSGRTPLQMRVRFS